MKYPLGIQTFAEIREENYLYVDKTALIHDLIQSGKVYFLSRPRRFGKSLLISTLEALFSGEKALFDGLAIADSNYDFPTYSVIKLEFTKDEYDSADNLRDSIDTRIKQFADHQNIELTSNTYNQRFDELVVKLHEKTRRKVVLLIDEYDKPILNNLDNPNKSILTEVKQVMTAFYGVVKSLDEHLKFVFITGVSKFAKISVFSGMNNLTDISLNREYATLCGITASELENHFTDGLTQLTLVERQSREVILKKIKHWYNGYRFHHSGAGVYNPYSVLSLFRHKEFKNYWFTTATPTFLLKLVKDKKYDLKNLSQFKMGESGFDVSEPENMEVQAMFVQTGYLTIKSYNAPLYTLDFPNYEVKKSFYDSVVGYYSKLSSGPGETYIYNLVEYLNAGQLKDFFATLRIFFANIPYDINLDNEKYYQSLFYAIFTLLGFQLDAEVRTNNGRIDCVLQTADVIYIIEFKLNDSKEAALKQILDKQYAQKYQNSGKNIVLLGVAFEQASRNIGDFLQHDLTPT